MTTLSDAQHLGIIICSIFSGTLSIIGSGIVLKIARTRLPRATSGIRLVVGMSVADLLFSVNAILINFLRPQYLDIPGAIGNTASCSFVGFVTTSLLSTVALYSLCISGNTFLVACRGWRENETLKWEKWGQWIAWLLPLSHSIPALATGSINPIEFDQICLYESYPIGCNSNDEIECERGEPAILLGTVLVAMIVIPTIISCYFTIQVYRNFKQTIHRVTRYSFAGSSSSPATEKRVEIVQWQTIRYTIAYLNTIVWPMASLIVATVVENTDNLYWLRICTAFFYPLQGVLFCLIFCLPSVHSWRTASPDSSLREILRFIIIENQSTPPSVSSRQMNRSNLSRLSKDDTNGQGSSKDQTVPDESTRHGEDT